MYFCWSVTEIKFLSVLHIQQYAGEEALICLDKALHLTCSLRIASPSPGKGCLAFRCLIFSQYVGEALKQSKAKQGSCCLPYLKARWLWTLCYFASMLNIFPICFGWFSGLQSRFVMCAEVERNRRCATFCHNLCHHVIKLSLWTVLEKENNTLFLFLI